MATALTDSMLGTGGSPSQPAMDDAEEQELSFDPGELAPYPASPFPPADLDEEEGNAIDALCDLVGNKDVAARRWEVEQSWEAQLMRRGYQFLFPRRGGGWILPPFATDYRSGGGRGSSGFGYETNIVATYEEIMEAALTRDIPEARGEPFDPTCDADITAACRFTDYARIFSATNDLLSLHHQIAFYLSTDGRVCLLTDHVLDANRFGRVTSQDLAPPVTPETEQMPQPALYLVRHGETDLNAEHAARGRSSIHINDRGARQMQATADWLKSKHVPAVVSSPVPRALESADIVSQSTGAPLSTDDRLASLDTGTLAGGPASAVGDEIDQNGSDQPIGGGESLDEFNQRVQSAFTDALHSQAPGTALVVHDSVLASIYKMLHGESVPAGGLVPPGGCAAVHQQPDGTMTVSGAFPYATPAPASGQSRGMPRGREVTRAYGKLQHKVPMGTQEFCDMGFVQISYEIDVAMARAMFPEFADKITPGQKGAGENELDRIARINACLALEASYVTGDSMVRDCTLQQTFFRPGFLMEVEDKEVRASLLRKFPDGLRVIHAGRTRVLARNENMDDHVYVFHAFPGAGQNRLALGSKLISVQKRLNNWLDLMNAYYIRTVPSRVFDSDIFDPEALKKQSPDPGKWIPYSGQKLSERSPEANAAMPPIWVEPTPTHQPSMPEFIKLFIQDLPQLLTGALPSLFGSPSNTDTVGGIAIQRDQALARLGTPWHAVQMAACAYFKQAVQLAARCRTEPVRGTVSGHAVEIELADLRGQILVRPEVDANFPESWNQQQQRYQQMLADASNPLVASILSNPANLLRAQQLLGMPGIRIKQADAYAQQLGEFDALLRGEPVPNPDFDMQRQHIEAMQANQQKLQQLGQPADQEMQQVIDGAIKKLQATPEMLPSFQIGPKDNDSVHASACEDWYNGPEGRRMRNGTPEDKAHAQNVLLHWQQHDARAAQQAANQPAQPPKPLSISANVKDLPPADAAAILQRAGLPSTPQGMAQGRELDAQIRKSSKVNE